MGYPTLRWALLLLINKIYNKVTSVTPNSALNIPPIHTGCDTLPTPKSTNYPTWDSWNTKKTKASPGSPKASKNGIGINPAKSPIISQFVGLNLESV